MTWIWVNIGSGNGLLPDGDKPLLDPMLHDNITKWKHFPHYWPLVRGIHRSLVNSPHKGQWRGALMFSLICAWINSWVNNCEAGDLRRHRTHYDVIGNGLRNSHLWWSSLAFYWEQFRSKCPTLVHAMAWCCRATSQYQSPCWTWCVLLFSITRPQWVKLKNKNCNLAAVFEVIR